MSGAIFNHVRKNLIMLVKYPLEWNVRPGDAPAPEVQKKCNINLITICPDIIKFQWEKKAMKKWVSY